MLKPAPDATERATVDLANRESIAACVGTARENARQVREEISSEMWEEINRLFLAVQRRQPVESEWTAGTHEFLTSTITGVHQIQGVTDATMTHSEGWHYIELGRYLERDERDGGAPRRAVPRAPAPIRHSPRASASTSSGSGC